MRQNNLYLILSVVFILTSALIAFYFLGPQTPSPSSLSPSPMPTSVADLPTGYSATTPSLSPSPLPTSAFQTYVSDADSFSISYGSGRKLYPDKEFSGNRYTLYSTQGNIAIHVGKKWSWSHPGRAFTTDFLVASQPTFVYELPNQTIVDFQFNGKNYTIQCVHNNLNSIKAECEQLMKDFQLIGTGSGS